MARLYPASLLAVALCAALGTLGSNTSLAQGVPSMAPQFASTEAAWPARVGRLVEVQGVVWLYDRDEGSWTQARHNRPLTSGDRLSTERGSRAELRIGSSTLRLGSDTELSLTELDDRAISVDLSRGSLAVRVTTAEVLQQIVIRTAHGRFVPRATGHYRIDTSAESSHASAWRGTLQFEGRDSGLAVAGGQRAELWQQGQQGQPASTHYRWLALERDAFADWVARDDTDPDRSESVRHVAAEMTGWEDLDRHGRWQTHPELGSVWFPSSVASSWEPYRDGRWQWVSPWGWTWIDAAPWGFAPFHYGRWVRWGGRWCWVPGARGVRPHYAPALVQWTPAPHSGGGHRPPPPTVWQPLAPHEPYRPHQHGVPAFGPGVVAVPPAPPAPHGPWRGEGNVPAVPRVHGRADADPPTVPRGERRGDAGAPPPPRGQGRGDSDVPAAPRGQGREQGRSEGRSEGDVRPVRRDDTAPWTREPQPPRSPGAQPPVPTPPQVRGPGAGTPPVTMPGAQPMAPPSPPPITAPVAPSAGPGVGPGTAPAPIVAAPVMSPAPVATPSPPFTARPAPPAPLPRGDGARPAPPMASTPQPSLPPPSTASRPGGPPRDGGPRANPPEGEGRKRAPEQVPPLRERDAQVTR